MSSARIPGRSASGSAGNFPVGQEAAARTRTATPRTAAIPPRSGSRAAPPTDVRSVIRASLEGHDGRGLWRIIPAPMDAIVIRGAPAHNLKNISLSIPRNALVVLTGVSGSGKSSLAFDTLFAEGQRRYVESLSAYARQFLEQMEKPDVDSIEGLSPAISIEQKTTSKNPRSTVGTVTEIYDY